MKPCVNQKCNFYNIGEKFNCEEFINLSACVIYLPEGGEATEPATVAPPHVSGTQVMIETECDYIKRVLLSKNRKYGDSAVHPIRVFSKADPLEQINVRLDDKLSRLINRQADEDEDVELDLIGYLILKRIAKFITVKDTEK